MTDPTPRQIPRSRPAAGPVAPGVTRFRVVHVTEYRYDDVVGASYGRLHVLPRELPGQRVLSAEVSVQPAPALWREHTDHFGNRSGYFEIAAPHTELRVSATSLVERRPDPAAEATAAQAAAMTWEVAADRVGHHGDGPTVESRQFTLCSPLVPVFPAVADFARASFAPGRALGEAALDLMGRFRREFTYQSGVTGVTTTLAEVLHRRRGVCQDFAHLMTAALRSVGLPARYVSGYIETVPPPGREKLVGADATHAWVSLYVPGAGWWDLDPTNDQLVDERYVITAWGRDYGDVPPMKGVIFTESSQSRMHVSVDLARV